MDAQGDHTFIFESERLVARRYTGNDFDIYYRLNGDEDVMRYIRAVKPPDEAREFFRKILSDYIQMPGTGRWPLYLKESGVFVGSFAIIPVQQSPLLQLGYAFLKENWGKGYASESVEAGIRYAFDKLELKEIAGITYPDNIASQKVLLKNGFVFSRNITEDDNLELQLYLLRNSKVNSK